MAARVAVRYGTVDTPLGGFTVFASDAGIVRTAFDDEDIDAVLDEVEHRVGRAARSPKAIAPPLTEIRSYFAREKRRLHTPVDLWWAREGFSRDVLRAAIRVPYGTLMTYGDLAAAAGRPRAHRAAGHAMRVCPIEIWIPCHRIVPAGPGLGSYGGHPERREFLLRLERAI